jgi:hypothetical protein
MDKTESKVGDTGMTIPQWMTEIETAVTKREKDFRKDGYDLIKIYEAESDEKSAFNILYSNTEVLHPALYSSTPRPVVRRRFHDADPVGKVAADALQRLLTFLIDPADDSYASFDATIESAVLDALLPGRAVVRFDYDADVVDGAVQYETICAKRWPWDRFCHGFGSCWEEVEWIAYLHILSPEEAKSQFKLTEKDVEEHSQLRGEEGEDNLLARKPQDSDGAETVDVWEVWHKPSKSRFYIAKGFDNVLKTGKPLNFSGFFDTPEPLRYVMRPGTLVPRALYKMYEDQAKELNALSQRITRLVKAMRIRGLYDQTVEDMASVLEADDNVLMPAQNVASLSQGNGKLADAIWLVPIQEYVPLLQQLYTQRDQCKSVIYEIMGISDILRGSSVASETATAQRLKNQWGSLRIKRLQKVTERFVRQCLRMMAELAGKLSESTLKQMTGLPLLTSQEKAQLQAQVQMAQQMSGQVPPELQQQLQGPSWGDIRALLQNNIQRAYRIDVETNSTVDVEATEDKEMIGELLNALAQFFSGVGPMVESGNLPFESAMQMLLAIVRRFRFGPELEAALSNIKPPQQGAGGKEAAEQLKKAQEELQKATEKLKQDQQALAQSQMQLDFDKKSAMAELKNQQRMGQLEASSQAQIARTNIIAEVKSLIMQAQAQAKQMAMQTEAKVGGMLSEAREAESSQRADAAEGKAAELEKTLQNLMVSVTQALEPPEAGNADV